VTEEKRGWYWVLLVLVSGAGGAAGAAVVSALTTAESSALSLWAGDFVTSPGFAGVAAVAAAVIASRSIGRQVAVSRSTLDHQRDAADKATWWKTFEWASSRAVPVREDDNALPESVTISTLEGLQETATDDVQRRACKGMIEVLTPQVVMSDDAREASEATRTDPSAALEALISYVDASDGTPAASPAARAAVAAMAGMYHSTVLSALPTLGPNIQVHRQPPGTDSEVDAVVVVDGAAVGLEVIYSRTPEVVRARTRSAAQKRRAKQLNPLVVVSRFPSPFTFEEEAEMRAVVVQWDSSDDNDRLLEALQRASKL
jgi:hypothetical protein